MVLPSIVDKAVGNGNKNLGSKFTLTWILGRISSTPVLKKRNFELSILKEVDVATYMRACR